MIKPKVLTAATLALLFLAACGSSGIGDVLGGNNGTSNYEIRGTVDSVDSANRAVTLTNVSGYNSSMLSGGSNSGNSVRVYYDDRTPVTYNGQTYRPQDLERGDEVLVRVDESGNSLVASSMEVVRDVSTSGSSTWPGTNDSSTVRGTVRNIDTSRRTIEVDRGNGSVVTIDYDTNTPVYYSNQTYRIADLERGDEIDIRVRSTGSNRWMADQINVVRSVSDNGTWNGSSNQSNTIRGTVRYVDTSRRTIELESASWRSNFDTGTGGVNNGRVIVSYDTNTNVDVSGRLYPVSGLERGDVIEVQVQNANTTTPFAQRIVLVRDASQ
ncbi:MAG: hypothetical protein ABI779_00885 [Acidobacteriota bacterium]